MLSTDIETLEFAIDALAAGQRVVWVTVLRTFGSAPRPVGAVLAVCDDGLQRGSVSGGCVDEDIVRRCRGAWPVSVRRVAYGVTRGEAERFGLPCGGELEVVLEPLTSVSALRPALAAIERRTRLARVLDLATGSVRFRPASGDESTRLVDGMLHAIFGPQWRLLIIGAGQTARFLVEMASALDYDITLCEPRPEHLASAVATGARVSTAMPDDAVRALAPDARTVIVTLAHDPKIDDLALIEALASEAFYVGALGSTATSAARRERLRTHFDLSPAALARLHAPVGLPLGGRTPPEIALAVLAELTALRHGRAIAVPAQQPAGVCRGVR